MIYVKLSKYYGGEFVMDIKLNDILNISEQNQRKFKVKFNNWTGENPIQTYLRDEEIINNYNLFWRTNKRYFNVGDIVINFIKIDNNKWLLTTIKEVSKELFVTGGQNYEGIELKEYSALFGRLIIRYRKESRGSVLKYTTCKEKLVIEQLLSDSFGGEEFPGYDNISLSYKELELILRLRKKDWITALENQKAVYLITDKQNGKLYVGSATSNYGMLLQRWQSYVDNGHGGNKELRILVEKQGLNYVKENFQYSVLENYNGKIDDKFVLKRESWWKEVLKSREHGYNAN